MIDPTAVQAQMAGTAVFLFVHAIRDSVSNCHTAALIKQVIRLALEIDRTTFMDEKIKSWIVVLYYRYQNGEEPSRNIICCTLK